MTKNVCILFGGKSQEHEVSRQSAASVFEAIDRTAYRVFCVGIERDGAWHLQDPPEIVSEEVRGRMLLIRRGERPLSLVPGRGVMHNDALLPIDVVLPVLHGPYGEDGTLQGLLEMLDLPYTGAAVLGSALAMDKEIVKIVWKAQGIPVVDFLTVHQDESASEEARRSLAEKVEQRFGWPVFVKPARAGSSVGVGKAADASGFSLALDHALAVDTKVIVERAVDAREIECAVIGNGPVQSFPPGEIVSSHDFYSYEAKYLDPSGARPEIPAALSPVLARRARELAERAFLAADVQGYARVDLFLERGTDNLYLNEINTLPGCTNISMFPRLCESGGLPFTRLIDRLITLGIERHASRSRIDYGFRRD